jgi:hypothetical protein
MLFGALACAFFAASFSSVDASVTTYSKSQHGYQWEPVATDARINGNVYSWNTVRADWQSAHRACALIEPTSYATSMTTGKFKSPKNNTIIWWDGSIWHLASAKTFNSYIQGLTCASDAQPNPSLAVSPASIRKGESATLTWDAGAHADERQVSCTASNFSVGYVIPGYMSTQWICGDFFGCFPLPVWIPEQHVEQRSGSILVSPPQTTTYSYTCSNPNGTVVRTATLSVVSDDEVSEDDEAGEGDGVPGVPEGGSGEGNGSPGDASQTSQCADGLDNNGNGLADYPDDPTCASPSDTYEEPIPDASLSLSPNRSIIPPGASAVLSWRAEHVVPGSCRITGDNGDSWSLSGSSGSRTSSALTAQTLFTLSCTDLESEEVSVSATVRVAPRFEEI